MSHLLQPLIALAASASNEATVPDAGQAMELTSFGTLSTMLAWMVLVALNAWCFRRILRRRPAGLGRPLEA